MNIKNNSLCTHSKSIQKEFQVITNADNEVLSKILARIAKLVRINLNLLKMPRKQVNIQMAL